MCEQAVCILHVLFPMFVVHKFHFMIQYTKNNLKCFYCSKMCGFYSRTLSLTIYYTNER